MKAQHAIRISIISRQAYQKRTIAIANGEYRPTGDEPKTWFESLETMVTVLNSQNQENSSTPFTQP